MRRRIERYEMIRRQQHLRTLPSMRMLIAFAPDREWRKKVRGHLEAGPDLAFYEAMICGTAWAAPLAHELGSTERRCLCGRRSVQTEELDVHFILGQHGCSCCRTTRRAHAEAVRRIFNEHGLEEALEAAAQLSPRDEAAFRLGSPRRWPSMVSQHLPTKTGSFEHPRIDKSLPRPVQLQLTEAFLHTFGSWSARSLRLGGRDADVTTGPSRDE